MFYSASLDLSLVILKSEDLDKEFLDSLMFLNDTFGTFDSALCELDPVIRVVADKPFLSQNSQRPGYGRHFNVHYACDILYASSLVLRLKVVNCFKIVLK